MSTTARKSFTAAEEPAGRPSKHPFRVSIPASESIALYHDQQVGILAMVANPRSSLRFSVRREDLSRSQPHPSSTDTCSTRTTSNDSPLQQPNDIKNNTNGSGQSKAGHKNDSRTRQLPDRRAKPQLRQSPLSQQPQAPSLPPPGHERPLKKAKLDGGHEPNAASVAKLPLRSRDAPDLRNGSTTITTKTTRTRTRATSGAIPSPHTETTLTRPTRHNKATTHHLPVAVDEDAKKQGSLSPPSDNNAAGRSSKGDVTPNLGDGGGRGATNKGAKNVPDPTGRRSLRSHDGGSRSKSELAMYFQNYEQMISLEPQKPGMFSLLFNCYLHFSRASICLSPVPI